MPEDRELPKKIETLDRAWVYDYTEAEWYESWLKAYGRKKAYQFTGAESFNCEAFEKFILKIGFSAPTGTDRVKVGVFFSADNNDWYRYETPPFDALLWELGAPAIKVCLSGACIDNHIKIEDEGEVDASFEITLAS